MSVLCGCLPWSRGLTPRGLEALDFGAYFPCLQAQAGARPPRWLRAGGSEECVMDQGSVTDTSQVGPRPREPQVCCRETWS